MGVIKRDTINLNLKTNISSRCDFIWVNNEWKIKAIDLSKMLIREIPLEISGIDYLEELIIDTNPISHIPMWIWEMKSLKILSAKCVHIKWINIPEFANSNIETLCLSGLKEIPVNIGQLKKLKKLDLSDCYLLENLPPEIGTLNNLIELNLCSTSLTDESLNKIVGLESLQYLDVSRTDLTILPSWIGKLKNINIIKTYGTDIVDVPMMKGFDVSKTNGKVDIIFRHGFDELARRLYGNQE